MPTQALFGFQTMGMTLAAFLILRKYFRAPTKGGAWTELLEPLLLIQTTRFIGIAFAASPLAGDPHVGWLFRAAALGDVAAGLLAVSAVAWIRGGWRGWAVPVVLVNVVGIADLLVVSIGGAVIGFPDLPLGALWFIPTTAGPFMMVSHAAMIGILLRAAKRGTSP